MERYELIWSPFARLTYIETLEYLEQNWPNKVTSNFIDRTEEVLNHISENPYLYPYSQHINAYRCVVVKQISLFYKVSSSNAELLIFWDNRQDLSKLISLFS